MDFSSVIATKTQFREQLRLTSCRASRAPTFVLVKVFYISLRIGTRGVASSGMTNVAPSIRTVLRPVEGFIFGGSLRSPKNKPRHSGSLRSPPILGGKILLIPLRSNRRIYDVNLATLNSLLEMFFFLPTIGDPVQ